jgi:hypothetical protein
MEALENFFLGSRQVLDTSARVPEVREAKWYERITRWYPRKSVFFTSAGDLDRLATECEKMRTVTLDDATMPRLDKIHEWICRVGKGTSSKETRKKASMVSAAALGVFPEIFDKAPQEGREPIVRTYLSSARRGLPTRQKSLLSSILDSAERLQEAFPESARKMIDSVNEAADSIHRLTPVEDIPWYCDAPTGKEETEACQSAVEETMIRLVQECVGEEKIDEKRLCILLDAVDKLNRPLWDKVGFALRNVVKDVTQRPKFAGFDDFETVEHIQLSLWDQRFWDELVGDDGSRICWGGPYKYWEWPYKAENEERVRGLLDTCGEKVVKDFETALREGNRSQQIDLFNRLKTLVHGPLRDGPCFRPRAIEAKLEEHLQSLVTQEFITRVSSDDCNIIYGILENLSPFVAGNYATQLAEEKKKGFPPDNLNAQITWMVRRYGGGASLPHPAREKVDEFITEKYRSLIRDIGQGVIPLDSIDLADNRDTLLRLGRQDMDAFFDDIFRIYKDDMEGLQAALGDHAAQFFARYGARQAKRITESLPKEVLYLEHLDSLEEELKRFSRIPPQFRNPTTIDAQSWEIFSLIAVQETFQKKGRALWPRMGRICLMIRKLFPHLTMPPITIPEAYLKLVEESIKSNVSSKENWPVWWNEPFPDCWSEFALEGHGYEDPVRLMEALPIDEGQKQHLIQVITQALPKKP